MKLHNIRLSNFQCFGCEPTTITLEEIIYLIGPNGSGKTAALQALCRLFAFNPSLKRVLRSDFHIPHNEVETPDERSLWIEAEFQFPELLSTEEDNSTVPPNFAHMRLDDPEGIPRVRYRLEATMGIDGDIEEKLLYVLDVDANNNPVNTRTVSRLERNDIQIHYLPARRDPSEHITYSTNALIGKMIRSINWQNERENIKALAEQISENLSANSSISALNTELDNVWKVLHKGNYFTEPKLNFISSEVESLLRHLTISFSPGHDESSVDFSRLSDGQKSMLYLALALSSQAIGRAVLSGKDDSFSKEKLRPPIFTLIALEEPENSLSPYYLGRIIGVLKAITFNGDVQALIATHAPSMLRRVEPESIRYLRLDEQRKTKVTSIQLPEKTDEAHKFVREAVLAFPEIYFSRLVILGEGDSEEIVLPRLLRAKGVPVDEFGVTVAPLGGRHVNHFWRLLASLKIPYLTLLDLDVARYQGGWGRIKYVNDQLNLYKPKSILPESFTIPDWNDDSNLVRAHYIFKDATKSVFTELEDRGIFFSYPMDLDFSLLYAYPAAYPIETEEADDGLIRAILGKSCNNVSQYKSDEKELFGAYKKLFKLGSKPAAHIEALSKMTDEELVSSMPISYANLADAAKRLLETLPE